MVWSKRSLVAGFVGLGVTLITGAAAADPKTHDGFYFRGATGLSYLSDSESISEPGIGSISGTISGPAIGFDLWFGGTPVPGLAIGGGITGYDAPSPKIKAGGVSSTFNGHAQLSIVGLFGDYYFDPHAGLHAEALVGYGVLSAQNNNGTSSNSNDPTGLTLGVGFGNDWWVSDEWSIGVLGRLMYAPLSVSVGGATEKDSVITPAIMATFTCH